MPIEAESSIITALKRQAYMSAMDVDAVRSKATGRKELKQLNATLRMEFTETRCPSCGATGFYRWELWGKLAHPTCGSGWYVSGGTYAKRWLRGMVREGFTWMGESREGCMPTIGIFFIGLLVRPVLALVLTPVQMVVARTSGRSGTSISKENK